MLKLFVLFKLFPVASGTADSIFKTRCMWRSWIQLLIIMKSFWEMTIVLGVKLVREASMKTSCTYYGCVRSPGMYGCGQKKCWKKGPISHKLDLRLHQPKLCWGQGWLTTGINIRRSYGIYCEHFTVSEIWIDEQPDYPRLGLSVVKIGCWSPLVPSSACSSCPQFHQEHWRGLSL